MEEDLKFDAFSGTRAWHVLASLSSALRERQPDFEIHHQQPTSLDIYYLHYAPSDRQIHKSLAASIILQPVLIHERHQAKGGVIRVFLQ